MSEWEVGRRKKQRMELYIVKKNTITNISSIMKKNK